MGEPNIRQIDRWIFGKKLAGVVPKATHLERQKVIPRVMLGHVRLLG
jgi:hypothetical protein